MSATVRDLMTSPVVTATPTTGFKEVARLLRDNGFSAVPVVDADGRVIGLVSEADLHGPMGDAGVGLQSIDETVECVRVAPAILQAVRPGAVPPRRASCSPIP